MVTLSAAPTIHRSCCHQPQQRRNRSSLRPRSEAAQKFWSIDHLVAHLPWRYEDWNVHLRIHILLVLVVLLEPFDLGRHWHRIANMSFAYRGNRADIESGFPGFIHERPTLRIHGHRPVNSNSLAFLVTAVLLLFMVLNSHQMSSNFLLWLVVGVFLLATSLRMYATCQQLQAQARAHAAAASGLLGHTELRVHMPPSIAFATRGRLQGLRLQLALLDREFDNLDYDTLRALDSENVSTTLSMSEEEINALPVHKYKASGVQRDGSLLQKASSSSGSEMKQESRNADATCHVCISSMLTALILGCDNKAHALSVNSSSAQHGGKAGIASRMDRTWFKG
ncbi:hypothetical protein NL676_005978 [Syzygium grande]|nr:hypothetical protein NL676_005978 [Syzygium grande]